MVARITRNLRYLVIFLSIAVFAGCAPSKKNTWAEKRKTATRVNTSTLGRNRFFYSNNYQKKLNKTYKNKRR
jgi:hypothetical protein